MQRNKTFCLLLLLGLGAGTIVAGDWWEAVADGSFEAGSNVPPWMESSTVGYPVVVNTPGPARTGNWYASFGSYDVMLATTTLEQDVTLGSNEATLSFWFMRPFDAENDEDTLQVFMDGIPLWMDRSEAGGGALGSYTNVTADLNDFADGQNHLLRFVATTSGTTITGTGTQWLVDDVSILTRNAAEFEADFIWSPAFPTWEEEVQFMDTSGGEPDTWNWDFGDGSTSVAQNPLHPYGSAGLYEVTLTVGWSAQQIEDSVTQTVRVFDPLKAFFSWSPDTPRIGEEVTFFNGSSGEPDSSSWNFGDGTTSTERHPTHVFEEPGNYIVLLMVGRSEDNSSSHTHHTITVTADLLADFTWEPAAPVADEPITLLDASWGDPTSWLWAFPDGTTATGPTATITFDEPGAYDVSLTVTRESDGGPQSHTQTKTIEVGAPPLNAQFTWAPSMPMTDENVHFTNLTSADTVSWMWAFGDGTTSSQENPIHSYSAAGSYTVLFQVSDAYGNDAQTVGTITVTDDSYVADFNWTPQQPMAGQDVQFQDLSRGGAQEWFWDFGDGAISHQQHPAHRFVNSGVFAVSLIVTFDADGAVTRTLIQDITVTDVDLDADFVWTPSTPEIDEVVRFTDISRGHPTSWAWDFGDGGTSILPNPTHIYRSPGQYTVTLTLYRDSDDTSTETAKSLVVADSVEIDFSWAPDSPQAGVPVQFTEDVVGSLSGRFWSFSDASSSTEMDPVHIFNQPGTYQVSMIAYGSDGTVVAAARHDVVVDPAELQPAIEVSTEVAEIGQGVVFHVVGIDTADRLEWDFGALGCGGGNSTANCSPTQSNDCLTASYRYSSSGLKPVRLTIIGPGQSHVVLSSAISVEPGALCTGPPIADFSWWPASPKVGERIRWIDESTGPPSLWQWTFDDGAISIDRNPEHAFTSAGQHTVGLAVSNSNGTSEAELVIDVAEADTACGNGVCDPGESSWTCAVDCGGAADGTWRAGRPSITQTVSAAAGGIPGANGTYWLSSGTVVNPGPESASAIVDFVADDAPLVVNSAGPLTIPPRTALTYENIVDGLFGLQGIGGLWIDADAPIITNTRTYNQSTEGTYGQGIAGVPRSDSLTTDEGELYLVGLRQNQGFRTNVLIQEVSGVPATATIQIFNGNGQLVANTAIDVAAHGRWQQPISALGVDHLDAGFGVISTQAGGSISALGSVVDRLSGDATTIDAVHRQIAVGDAPAKLEEVGDAHYLVAVVAQTPGANDTTWKSEISIFNGQEETQQLELRYVPRSGAMETSNITVEAKTLFSSVDVLGEVFPAAENGAGALHVFAGDGLVVSSRTYNVLDSGATLGQALPGLAAGDMARPGEVWVLDSLMETIDFRCNIGFAEFEGSSAEVTVSLFNVTDAAFDFLAAKTYTVPPLGHFQVNRIVRDMGLTGWHPGLIAYLSVTSEGGAVYAYASVVDNVSGDGTTILAKRR